MGVTFARSCRRRSGGWVSFDDKCRLRVLDLIAGPSVLEGNRAVLAIGI